MNNVMPEKYLQAPKEDLIAGVKANKKKFGPELVILTHHYQAQEIVNFGDFSGDSFLLSKKAAENKSARYIVFCGVHFMAESAAVLAREDQAVFLPAMNAGCPMADMASVEQVESAWNQLAEVVDPAATTPITYVNSTAAVKAFCGENGGATCTSSNADSLFEWAFSQGERILFLPDEHLGRNTAANLDVGPVELWDPAKPMGGLTAEQIENAKVIVWKGYCHVHTAFTLELVNEARSANPGAKVVVHPECERAVVAAADASGSTSGIIKYVAEQPAGTTIVVGTEINLVQRLAKEYEGVKTVLPLCRSLCPNMFRIKLAHLAWTLDAIAGGKDAWANEVKVSGEVKKDAALALRRMLENAR